MIINLPSKFNRLSNSIQFLISLNNLHTPKIEIISNLSKYLEYYSKYLYTSFDYSHFSMFGFHNVVGYSNTPLHNLIALLAYDENVSHRENIWIFSNESKISKFNAIERFHVSKDMEILLYIYYDIIKFVSNFSLDNSSLQKIDEETWSMLKIINPHLELYVEKPNI